MPSPVYQYVLSRVVSLTIRKAPGVLLNVSAREHRALNKDFFCGKVHYSNTFNITILKYTLIPDCRFENIISHNFCIKIP